MPVLFTLFFLNEENISNVCLCLFERQSDKVGGTGYDICHLLISAACVGQIDARSQELHPSFPYVGPYHLLPPERKSDGDGVGGA